MARRRFVRDLGAGSNLDLFLVCAVTALLTTRFLLHLAGYPRVGGDSLHIAHVLWGGLLMLGSLVLLLSYLTREVRRLASIVGGVGFGLFIDELGKFLTHDNDYFYRPAVALIYLVFIGLYLAVRTLHRESIASPEENLVNALREFHEVALDDLDPDERARAEQYLRRAPRDHPLVPILEDVLRRASVVPRPDPDPLTRLRRAAGRLYRRMTALPGFSTGLAVVMGLQLLARAGQVTAVIFFLRSGEGMPELPVFGPVARPLDELGVGDWGQILSGLVAAGMVAAGIWALPQSRLRAYRHFQRSVLVSIFVTQVFMFFRDAWSALLGLAVNLLVYAALTYMIEHERTLPTDRAGTGEGSTSGPSRPA